MACDDLQPVIKALSEKVLAKLKKDPAAPRKPIGAFLEFSKIRRPQIVTEHPNLSGQDVSRNVGQEWRSMKEAVKKRFQDIEAADRQRYDSEMEAYNHP